MRNNLLYSSDSVHLNDFRSSSFNRSTEKLNPDQNHDEHAPYADYPPSYPEKNETPYCWGRLSKRAFIIMIVLIVAIIIGAILLGVLIPIIGKEIASNAVGNAAISVSSLSTAVQNGQLLLNMNGSVYNSLSISATLQPFTVTMSLVLSPGVFDTAVGTLQMPQLYIASGTSDFEISSLLTITDNDAFDRFVQHLINDTYILINLVGDTDITALSLTFDGIPFNKTLNFTGMGGLQQLQVDSFDLSSSTSTSLKFVLEATLESPSQVTVQLGPATFSLYYESTYVGIATSVGPVTIEPGQNLLSLAGSITTTDLNLLDNMFSKYLAGQPLVVSTGIAPGGLQSPLLEAALSTWSVTATLPSLPTPLISDIEFVDMGLEPVSDTLLSFSATINIHISSPLGPNVVLNISEAAVVCDFLELKGGEQIQVLSLNIPTSPVSMPSPNIIQLTTSLLLNLSASDELVFSGFVHDFVSSQVVQVLLQGTTSTDVQVGSIGVFHLGGVPVNVDVGLNGMNNLSNNTIVSIDFTQSTSTEIFAVIGVEIINPSIATVPLGFLQLNLDFDGVTIGLLNADGVTFVPGSNSLVLVGVIYQVNANTTQPVTDLFNNYVAGKPSVVSASASPNSVSNQILNAGLQGVVLTVIMPGSATPLISGIAFSSLLLSPDYTDQLNVFFAADTTISIVSPLGPNGYLQTISAGISASIYTTDGTLQGQYVVSPLVQVQSSSSSVVSVYMPGNLTLADNGVDFSNFILDFVNNASITLNVIGGASVVVQTPVGTLTLHGIPVNSLVTIQGIGGLDTVDITQLSLPSNALPYNPPATVSGINLNVVASLSNPSISTFDMGTIKLNVTYMGTYQGYAIIDNFVFAPGVNTVSGSGLINPAEADLAMASQFFTNYISGVASAVSLHADVVDSAQAPPWFVTVIQSLKLSGSIAAPPNLEIIQTVSLVPPLSASLPQAPTLPELAGNVNVIFKNPFNFVISVQLYAMTMSITNSQNQLIGTVTIPPWSPVNSGQLSTNTYSLNLGFNADLAVVSQTYFTNFIQSLISQSSIPITISGFANVTAYTGAGAVILSLIPFQSTIDLVGFNNFKSPNGLSVTGVQVTAGSGSSLQFEATLQFTSASSVNALLGPFVLSVTNSAGQYIGYTSQNSNIYIPQGTTTISLPGVFDSSTTASSNAIVGVLSSYVQGNSVPLYLSGLSTAPSSPLQNAFNSLNPPLSATLPPIARPIIKSMIYGSITSIRKRGIKASSYVIIDNSVGVNITLQQVNLPNIYYSYSSLGSYNAYLTSGSGSRVLGTVNEPSSGVANLGTIVPDVPPYNGQCTDAIDVDVTSFDTVTNLGAFWLTGAYTKMYLAVKGTMTVLLDKYQITLNYQAYDVLLSSTQKCPS